MGKTKDMDMTRGPVFRQLTTFAIPVLFGMVFQKVYNFADAYIVGHYLGDEALAAVSICGTVMFMLFSINVGISTGVGVVVSQFFGANKPAEMKKAFVASVYVAMGVVVLATAIGIFTAEPVLGLMQTSDELMPQAKEYLVIIYAGCIGTMLYNFCASVLRAVGNSVVPLVFLIISSVLNIVLDILFVSVIPMGAAGAALATVVAQFVSGVLCIIYARRILDFINVKGSEWKPDFPLIKEVLRYGIPAALQMSIISIGDMTLQAVVNTYGTAMVVAYGVCLKVEGVGWEITNAIGMAVGTFTGQNVGAGNLERVKKGVRSAYIMNIIGCGIFGIAIVIFAPQIMGAFTETPEAIRLGVEYMRIFAGFFLAGGILVIFQNFLRSVGDVTFTLMMGVSEIITRVGFSFLFPAVVGYIGLWFVSPITWVVAMIVGLARYYSKAWVKKAEANARS